MHPILLGGIVKLQDWKDVVAVSDERSYIAGLKEDGTVRRQASVSGCVEGLDNSCFLRVYEV